MQSRVKRRVWLAVGAGLGLLLLLGSALATDRAEFCPTCHEMQPYYDSWARGPHEESATCIDCHVEPGLPARLAHKPVALGEVWAHFFGNTRFPLATPPEIPSARCTRCHDELPETMDGFPHAEHTEQGACAQCHVDTGHVVTTAQLIAADAYAPGVKPARLSGEVATVEGGRANLSGHPTTSCQRCHDMRKTTCSACHEPPHEARGDCSTCHKPGVAFGFVHPSRTARCTPCHTAPAGNHPATTETCVACHTEPGVTWEFRHPGDLGEHSYRSFACAKCHPKNFTTASCTCHGGRPPEEDDD